MLGYTDLLGLAALLTALFVGWRSRRVSAIWGALGIGIAAWLCGRLGFLALHVEALREGQTPTGYAEHTALLGAWLAHQALQRWRPAWAPPAPSFALAVCAIGIAASLGCIAHGCAFGREVFWQIEGEHSLAWQLRADWPDDTFTRAPRLPTQLFMLAWLGAGALFALARRCSAAFGMWWFALGDFGVQFLRGDEAAHWLGLRVYQWLDLALGLGVVSALVITRLRATRAGR